MARTDLSEKQWRALEPHLPANPKRGHRYAEHRKVINGIVWRLKTGAPWRDIPERYGPWQTCWDETVKLCWGMVNPETLMRQVLCPALLKRRFVVPKPAKKMSSPLTSRAREPSLARAD